jgi:hypothetical protein
MASYPTSTSASGIWQLGDIPLYIQDGAWPSAGFRGLFAGGTSPTNSNVIDYINISSAGNATDFGDLTLARQTLRGGGISSSTRALFTAGYVTGVDFTNVIDYITIATTGNATDFGDSIFTFYNGANTSNSTRGIFTGMIPGTGWNNVLNYVTIASTGNAADFGDMANTYQQRGATSSSTRTLFAGGYSDPGGGPDIRAAVNSIEFLTIATTGNGTNFGDLTVARRSSGGMSSGTRGVFGGGFNNNGSVTYNVIDYVTIASAGNATDFGDMLTVNNNNSGTSDTSRGVLGGGGSPSITNVIQYITIATTGNAVDFGDLTLARTGIGSASNGHGGLS